jgi:enoyl-CoA hydratase
VTASSPEAEALVERRGRAGVIVLNRPKALNALTLTMVRLIGAALDEWKGDHAVDRVLFLGAGERAFCAGGDIRRLYELGRAGDHDAQLTFWREEYQLDLRIKTYPKPIVALMDGIVMGGGVGLAMHAGHTVAGERFVFAMPEVGIGFFPDVGASWLLPRLPSHAGVYFALTGLRANAGDAVAFGLAQTFVPSAAFPALAQALDRDPGGVTPGRDAGSCVRRAGASGDAGEVADQPGDRAEADGVGRGG